MLEKKQENEFYHLIEIGNIESIKIFLKNSKIKKSTIDTGIRNCILKNKNYMNIINELLNYADLNLINSTDNTTLLMFLCSKNNIDLIHLFFNQAILIRKNQIEIDLSKIDNNNYNFIFYILNNFVLEDDALECLIYILEYNNKLKKPKKTSIELLRQQDKQGNTPLIIILKKGWPKILKEYFKYSKYEKTNNNLIFYAIDGKNISCLKIILSYCTLDDLKIKNKNGDTPLNYANKNKYFYMGKIISFYENNFYNEKMKNLIINKSLNPNEILNYYTNNDYINCLLGLEQYKLNQNIISDIANISYEWNLLLVKKKTFLLKSQNNIQIYNKNFSNIKNENNNEKQIINSIYEIFKFFNKYNKNLSIIDNSNNDSFPIDLIIYNKIIFYFKIGDIEETIKTISYYLTYFCSEKENIYYKIISFTNITFILIEFFTNLNLCEFAEIIIHKLENYLIERFPQRNNLIENEDIINYLNKNEIINPFNPTWDDAFCYIYLLKVLNNPNYSKNYLSEFKKNLKNCNYKKKFEIFNRLELIYYMIKRKINYNNNFILKSISKILLLKDSNDSIECQLFFYNSLGIINLKLKNYHLAEMMFKKGINIYKSIFFPKNEQNNDVILIKSDYLYFIKYNLALSFFFQERYKDAYDIFKELTNVKRFNQNIYLWYRLGICSLEICIKNFKKTLKKPNKKEKIKKKIEDNEIYSQKKNKCEKEFDELFNQFEEEYGNNLVNIEKNNYKKNNNPKLIFNKNFFQSKQKKNNKYKEYLNESVIAFKRVLYIEKKGKNLNLNIESLKELRKIYNYYIKSEEEFEIKNIINSTKNIINQQIIISTILNLLFSLSLSGKYLEMILLIKTIKKEKWENLSNDIFIKIQYYKLEALISLGKIKESYELINSLLQDYNKDNFNITYFCKDNFEQYNELNLKSFLETSVIFLLCKENKYNEAEKRLNNLIKEIYINNNIDISQYYSNLLIYIYLSQNKKNEVLEFLKYKKLTSNKLVIKNI